MSFSPIKFYDSAAPDQPAAPTEHQSAAALLASRGRLVHDGMAPPAPAPATAVQEPAAATKQEPVEPASDPAKEPVKEPEPPKVPDWREVLKQDPNTVLKELGFDDKVVSFAKSLKPEQIEQLQQLQELDPKMVGFLNTWKNKGDVTAYLKAATTDYTQMSPEEVMRHQLQREYPHITGKDFELLYEAMVVDKYKLGDDLNDPDDKEVQRARVLLKADAEKARQELIKSQQEFLLPPPPEPKAAEPDPAQQEAEKFMQSYRQAITDNPYTKNILTSRKLTLGEGDRAFNLDIANPEELTGILWDSGKFFESLSVKEGDSYKPNVEKQMLVSAILTDYDGFKKAFDEHVKKMIALGAKQAIEPLENAKQPDAPPAASPNRPASPAAALAKMGRIVNG